MSTRTLALATTLACVRGAITFTLQVRLASTSAATHTHPSRPNAACMPGSMPANFVVRVCRVVVVVPRIPALPRARTSSQCAAGRALTHPLTHLATPHSPLPQADNRTTTKFLSQPYLNINIDTGSIYNGFDFMDTALLNYVRVPRMRARLRVSRVARTHRE